jgi:hypothetical protein
VHLRLTVKDTGLLLIHEAIIEFNLV